MMNPLSGADRTPAENFRWAVVVFSFLVLSGMNGVYVSFDPWIATIKLGLGLFHLAAIGWCISRCLSLDMPRHLAFASHALLGQVFALAYVYARSALCSVSGLPGIFVPEAMLAEAVLFWFAAHRGGSIRRFKLSSWPDQWPGFSIHSIWLVGLGFVALQKLDLLYTPSSDPDIHAFYAKIMIDYGRIYYDLEPFSDMWMVYPSGFSSLNLVMGLVSGLHPVQLVNIAPYVQFALFSGAAFSVLSQSLKDSRIVVLLAVFHFALAYLCFNPLFAPNRELLQGTPRLAHSALLFFPLFFAVQQSKRICERPSLLALPLCAIATGMCINPTHAPGALLFGGAALPLLVANPEMRNAWSKHTTSEQTKTVVLLATMMLALIATDPFYRSLWVQQSAGEGQVEEARNLTGNALSLDADIGSLMRDVIPQLPEAILSNPGGSGAAIPAQVALLLALFGALVVALASPRFGGRAASIPERELLLFAVALLLCLTIHAAWSEFTPHLVRPGVLQGHLLIRYTQSLQYQISTLFYGPAFTLLLVLIIGFAGQPQGPGLMSRTVAPLLALVTAVGLLLWLGPVATSQARNIVPKLRETSLGIIYPGDIEFARKAREQIGPDERILLPGNLRQTRLEHWVFTTGAGRAIPLYSDIRTSFFLGLDGWAFTAGAYAAHVQPPHFDPVWLRSQGVLWLVESGNFPQPILTNHYRRVFGDDHAVLWRLREPGH